jgi:hypothetical protein
MNLSILSELSSQWLGFCSSSYVVRNRRSAWCLSIPVLFQVLLLTLLKPLCMMACHVCTLALRSARKARQECTCRLLFALEIGLRRASSMARFITATHFTRNQLAYKNAESFGKSTSFRQNGRPSAKLTTWRNAFSPETSDTSLSCSPMNATRSLIWDPCGERDLAFTRFTKIRHRLKSIAKLDERLLSVTDIIISRVYKNVVC